MPWKLKDSSSPVSPPPFMAGMAEVELDKETGHVEILDYVAVVDCGTVINPNLARVQVEGGIVQGIGMALYENIQYTKRDRSEIIPLCSIRFRPVWIWENCGWSLRAVMSRQDRLVQNPSVRSLSIHHHPALAHAIANATGLWFRKLPITSEKIAMGLLEK